MDWHGAKARGYDREVIPHGQDPEGDKGDGWRAKEEHWKALYRSIIEGKLVSRVLFRMNIRRR
jgi:hypothetical protein